MTNLILIGPMSAGKTTVGRQLAHKLRLEFFDSDKEIESHTGVDIRTIFEYEGESGFRLRETDMIDKLTRKRNIILATGGGAVLNSINRRHIASRGHVILLNVSVDEQLFRTRFNKTRPLLLSGNRRAVLEHLHTERLPIYRSLANFEVDSNGRNMKKVVEKICLYLRQGGDNPLSANPV